MFEYISHISPISDPHYSSIPYVLPMASDPQGTFCPLVNIQKAIERGPFIVDFAIRNGDLPSGKLT